MGFRCFHCSILVAAFCSATAVHSASAQPFPAAPPPPPMMVPPAPAPPPSSLAVGNQYYDGDLDGFRRYLDAVQASDPQLFAKLDPKLTSLEEQRTTGTIVMWGGIAAGAVFTIWGVTKMSAKLDTTECARHQPLSDERSNCEDSKMEEWESEKDQGLTFAGIGLGIAAAGWIGGMLIKPGRAELLELVNEHNRANPSNAMRLQLGYSPVGGRAHAGLSLRFDVTNLH